MRGVEDDDAIFLELLLDTVFLLLLDPITSVTLESLVPEPAEGDDRVQDDDEDSSSFADAVLSPPQATRAMDKKRASRDCFAEFIPDIVPGLAMTFFARNEAVHSKWPHSELLYPNTTITIQIKYTIAGTPLKPPD